MLNNFRTYAVAVEFYRQSKGLRFSLVLKAQFERASASIVLNLAEGRGRQRVKDQQRFFHIAMGSVRECQAILEIAGYRGSPAWCSLDKLAAHLFRLIQYARG
jgi:four helix bundle protein